MRKKIILYLLLFPFLTNGQSFLEKMTLKVGIAKSEVDTRVSPKQFREVHTLDDEYLINISFKQPILKNIYVEAGLGYVLSVNDYNVYVNNNYFASGIPYADLHTVGNYYKHQLQPNLAIIYPFLKRKNFTYSAGILWNYNLYINKSIRNSHDGFTFSKWLFEPSLMELYPTANMNYKRFSLELGYRIFNRNYKDDAIDTFLEEGDTYNPIKFRWTVGYRLK